MLKRQGFIFFPKKGNTFRFLLLILQFVILRTEMKTEPTTYNLLSTITFPEDLPDVGKHSPQTGNSKGSALSLLPMKAIMTLSLADMRRTPFQRLSAWR